MIRSTLAKLLVAIAVVGILVAPFGRQAAAGQTLTQTKMAGAAMAMAGDMPCCPEQAPVQDCAKDCPLMALCATQLMHASLGVAFDISMIVLSRPAPASDAPLAGLGNHPPPKPPRFFA